MNDLNRLFYWHGIAEDYFNYKGELVKVSIENRRNLLRTMGVDVDSEMAVTKAAFEVDVAPWLHWLSPLITHPVSEEAYFHLQLNPRDFEKKFQWTLTRKGELIGEGSFIPAEAQETGNYQFQNTRYTRRKVAMGELKLQPGYYELSVCCNKVVERSCLAIIPETSWQPNWISRQTNPWGFIIQLYTLRSSDDWGMGDFSDLRQLIALGAKVGIDIIGLNPLHTLLPDLEENCSPYSPSDRRFLNPLYLDIEREIDFIDSKIAKELNRDAQHTRQLNTLREGMHVDYHGVKALKYGVFQRMFSWFKQQHLSPESDRGHAFLSYVKAGEKVLLSIGLYEAMYNRWPQAEYTAVPDEQVWRDGLGSRSFDLAVDKNKDAIYFHLYLQWLTEQQLEACQQLAVEKGLKLGLVRDLAVGANGSGCEVKSNADLFCDGASVGAPPDPFSDLGQNWGIPPMDPAGLRKTGYRHYIELLRANMSSCGALRIDHAMSLLRLWWCPPDKTADYGAYVYYPFEDLLGLLKLESHLNQCVIIGEDLGVVPDEFRAGMAQAKVFANKVFYFEKKAHNEYKAPQEYAAHALAMVNNHDVPTLTSWWDGSDLVLRDKLNLFEEGVDYPQMCDQRAEEKHQAYKLLNDQQLLPETWKDRSIDESADADLIFALLKLNSRVKSRMFVIQLEDLMRMDSPTNVPGTFKEYPNWQRKLKQTLEELFSDSSVQKLLEEINLERN